jgi:transposase InsO family protein
MVARALREWRAQLGIKTLSIEPGSPWENGWRESFNGKLRDECLKLEIFSSLKEAQVIMGGWKDHDNRLRPHSSWATGRPHPSPLRRSRGSYPHPQSCRRPSNRPVQNPGQVNAFLV